MFDWIKIRIWKSLGPIFCENTLQETRRRRSLVFIVNFEQFSLIALEFSWSTLSKEITAGSSIF